MNKGIPQVNLDQINPQRMFDGFELLSESVLGPQVELLFEGGVMNLVTNLMKLMWKRLLCAPDWSERRQSEWTQLDQYEAQKMFGMPTKVDSEKSVFNLVWKYVVKELDQGKKA